MHNIEYFLVPAPGQYGDVATVLSGHQTMAAAKRAARSWRGVFPAGVVIRIGRLTKGNQMGRSSECHYPVASEAV